MTKVNEARIRLTDTLTSEQCGLLADYIHELADALFRKEQNAKN